MVGSVDVVFADVAQPDQARIVALNSHHFLKDGGHALISIKASCIDSTAVPEAVFAAEVKKLQGEVSLGSELVYEKKYNQIVSQWITDLRVALVVLFPFLLLRPDVPSS